MKVTIIGDRDTVVGLQLAGAHNAHIAADQEQAREALHNSLDSGIIVLTEKLAAGLKPEIDKITEERPTPLIVEIQDKFGKVEKEDPIRLLIKSTIGVDIKKEEEK